jgi:hypothetical protein
MKRLLPLLLLLPIVVLGCASFGDSMFLLQKVDDQSKARVITQTGIDEYNLYLVQRNALDQIPRIKEYFNTALRFDPTNVQAKQYITLINTFKTQKLKANLASATKILAKTKRTDDDTYAMAVSLQTAARIDPTDPAVQKLLNDTAAERSKLVDSYMVKSRAALDGITDKTTDAAKEKQYVDSLQNANKAMTADPGNGAVQAQVSSVRTSLAVLVTKRVTAIQKLIAAGSYVDARTQVNSLSDLNKRAVNAFDTDVRTVSYSLNFSWAKALYAQKDYPSADTRVNAALVVNRTDEASSLKKQISSMIAKADTAVTFDVALKDIDRLISAGDLLAAHNKIMAVANVTTDQAKLSQLDDRDQAITDKLKDIYDKGVQAYKDEDFNTAVDNLQIVVGIQADYEQASDYLDKATSKQKLLNQF